MFTIITSTLNCESGLRKTALSIASQNFPAIQWIVADGGSSDGTLDVVEENCRIISVFIPGPDSGIYDAWNKACKYINNKWVIFLGAGDVFKNNNTLTDVAKFLESVDDGCCYVYGDVLSDAVPARVLSSGEISLGEWDLYRPRLPYHQGVFHNSIFLKGDQVFDRAYKIVSDSKLLIQLAQHGGRVYIPCEVSIMALGGASQSPKNAVLVMNEFFRLEKDLVYRIPFHFKLSFILITYTKFLINFFWGPKVYNRILYFYRELNIF